jgi:UDP-N-acetylglucosamine 2-epimerase (non-hydrolysing)
MIHIFIGTKAQLIKMAPVMVELQNRNIPYNFIFSGQHQATVNNIREEFGLKNPDITLYTGKDITGIIQMLLWSIRLFFYSISNPQKVWQGDKNGIVLNHGDTFSTLLGTILARMAGHKSAHVESGLRSFKLFHPFPEEITRVLTFKLSNIYFAPGEWALKNLEKYRGAKVNTIHNTLLDSLRISESAVSESVVNIPSDTFAVVSIHRFENIFSQSKLTEIIKLLIGISNKIPLLFILHKPTEQQINHFGLTSMLKNCRNIELRPRYSYFQFIKLIQHASLVITDGGSNQEECYYLGKPCIIMRTASERQEGLGKNAVISDYKYDQIINVIENLEDFESPPVNLITSPSKIIVDSLNKLSTHEIHQK